jgi:hypothetical protein
MPEVQENISVSQRLRKLADLYEERNAVYGDDYKRHGDIMTALFPDGLTLNTAMDFNRYGIFKELVTKLSRYAAQWKQGGHFDSLNDKSVYAQMLQELDTDWRELYTIDQTLPQPCGAHWRNVVVGNSNPIGCAECNISWDNVNKAVCPKSRHIKL